MTMYENATEIRLDTIEKEVKAINEKLDAILTNIDVIVSQAKPVIDQLTNSPLVKMITGM